MDPTPTMRLAGVLLGQPVTTWIAGRRALARPWRIIARDLYEATNGQIDVTHETIRSWADDSAKASA